MVVVLTSRLSNGQATMTHLCGACNEPLTLPGFRYKVAAAYVNVWGLRLTESSAQVRFYRAALPASDARLAFLLIGSDNAR